MGYSIYSTNGRSFKTWDIIYIQQMVDLLNIALPENTV